MGAMDPSIPASGRLPGGTARLMGACLEVGSGSGVVSALLASVTGPWALCLCPGDTHGHKVQIQPEFPDSVRGLRPMVEAARPEGAVVPCGLASSLLPRFLPESFPSMVTK